MKIKFNEISLQKSQLPYDVWELKCTDIKYTIPDHLININHKEKVAFINNKVYQSLLDEMGIKPQKVYGKVTI